jgi:hypothetical protein
MECKTLWYPMSWSLEIGWWTGLFDVYRNQSLSILSTWMLAANVGLRLENLCIPHDEYRKWFVTSYYSILQHITSLHHITWCIIMMLTSVCCKLASYPSASLQPAQLGLRHLPEAVSLSLGELPPQTSQVALFRRFFADQHWSHPWRPALWSLNLSICCQYPLVN